MKIGDYVRTLNGKIWVIKSQKAISGHKKDIINYSPNIIDLIEVGDYVNGVLVESIYQREKDKLYIHSFDTEIMMCFTNNNIKSIVTKEQFESMEYKVGE